jgi:hypothetical protein
VEGAWPPALATGNDRLLRDGSCPVRAQVCPPSGIAPAHGLVEVSHGKEKLKGGRMTDTAPEPPDLCACSWGPATQPPSSESAIRVLPGAQTLQPRRAW